MGKNERKCLYDWVSISSKIHSINDIISLLGMQSCKWEKLKGHNGYKDRLYFESVSIHYNGSADMGVFLEMSGQGCRAFETLGHGNFEMLFNVVISNSEYMNITRLDIAYDDKGDKSLPLKTILKDTIAERFVSKFKSYEYVSGTRGTTIYHGSIHSDVRLRIYDKAAERGYDVFDIQWVRCELQLRNDRALEFIKLQQPIGEKFAGVLLNYVRYIKLDATRKFNCSMTKYWSKIVSDVKAIRIYSTPGLEYNLLNIHRHVLKNCGGGIKVLLKIYGVEKFAELVDTYSKITNPKHLKVLTDFESLSDLKAIMRADPTLARYYYDDIKTYEDYMQRLDMLALEDIKEENRHVDSQEVLFERKVLEELELAKLGKPEKYMHGGI